MAFVSTVEVSGRNARRGETLRMCEPRGSGGARECSRRAMLGSLAAGGVAVLFAGERGAGAAAMAASGTQLSTSAQEYSRAQKLADHYKSAVFASENLETELRTLVALQMVDSVRQELRGPKFGNIRIDCDYLAREAELKNGVSRNEAQSAYKKLMQNVQNLDSLALKTSREKAPNNADKLDALLSTVEADFSAFLAMLIKPRAA